MIWVPRLGELASELREKRYRPLPATTTDVVRGNGFGSWVGTWGPGAFDNDGALDALSGQDTVARRHVLERIFREAREYPENLNFTLGAAEVVAAAAVVAAGLPAGGAVAHEITRHDYDVTALVIPGSDPELAWALSRPGAMWHAREPSVSPCGRYAGLRWRPRWSRTGRGTGRSAAAAGRAIRRRTTRPGGDHPGRSRPGPRGCLAGHQGTRWPG